MKKLLALVLALVMVMGLAAVGTNAAYLEDKYTDADSVNYDEAVAVMSSVGVLEGADNMFRPSVELKRSEAAKIVAYLNTNNRTAEGLVGVGKYSDVPANHWAAGYIEYLSTLSIVAGNGDNTYNPDGDLKAVDFAKMLLVVLGYDPTIEGLIGNDYQIHTTKLATDAGLFNGMPDLKPTDVLTREEAAQMAFNTIKAPTVEYSNKGGSISINGAEIAIGASSFNYVTTTIAKQQNISKRQLTNVDTAADSGYTVEFGERQYPDLYLNDEAEDPFGRPANEWTNGKEIVGKFINRDLMMGDFTVAVTGADLFELIGEAKIKNSKEIIYKVNGFQINYLDPNLSSYRYKDETTTSPNWAAYLTAHPTEAYRSYGIAAQNMIRGNKIPYALTGNGVLTEVYEKNDNLIIVSIYTYYAEAIADYDTRNAKLQFEVKAFDGSTATTRGLVTSTLIGDAPAPTFTDAFPGEAKSEDFPGVELTKYKKNDKLLIRTAYDEDTDDFTLVEIGDPKQVSEAVSVNKFSYKVIGQQAGLASWGLFYEGYLVSGGNTQNYSKAVYPSGLWTYDDDALDSTYDVVYDNYDYVIATKRNNAGTKYVFIAGVDNLNSNLGVRYADASAIFEDGSTATIRVNVLDTDKEIENYESIRTSGVTSAAFNSVAETTYKGVAADDDYSIHYDTLGTAATTPLHAYNRWFSYKVSGEGANAVYTLYPAANSLMINSTGSGTINSKGPRLIGNALDYNVGATAAVSKLSAWGNDDSVYITVKTGKVSSSASHATLGDGQTAYKRGISEIESIFTGIQSVDLEELATGAGDELNPFPQWLYAVYDKDDRYVKSAVVLGTNKGTDNYIYAVSSANSEEKIGSYYYWDFNAIVDGEQTVLTVKEKYSGAISGQIENAVKFHRNGGFGSVDGLFKVTYDAEGYVIAAQQVSWKGTVGGTASKYVYANAQAGGIQNSSGTNTGSASAYGVNYDGHTVYETYFPGAWNTTGSYANTIHVEGRTLYNNFNWTYGNGIKVGGTVLGGGTSFSGTAYEVGSDVGLTIASGAPVYVLQERYIESSGQYVADIEKFSDFKSAVGYIADSSGKTTGARDNRLFGGYVSAALNSSGTAKWVVLKNVTTVINYENNGAAVTPAGSKTVTLSDYSTSSGFEVVLGGGFKAGQSYSYKILMRAPGQDDYKEVNEGTVKLPLDTSTGTFGSYKLTFGGGATTVWSSGANINIHQTITSQAGYKFILEGITSNAKTAD